MTIATSKSEAAAEAGLAAILRLAYSGELAAAYAYSGHGRSVADAGERERIGQIEREELHHRELLGGMLAEMGVAPDRGRESRARLIGRVLGLLCHCSGWLAPMYGAGRLERRNIGEYEEAARLAAACGRRSWVDRLLTFAEVEWEHEAYFRARVLSHRLGRRLPIWSAPPPKSAIRASFEREWGAIEPGVPVAPASGPDDVVAPRASPVAPRASPVVTK